MSKAIVKDSEKLLDIESHYMVKHITMTLSFELSDEMKEDFKEMTLVHNESTPTKEGTYYTLSDGEQYHEDQLIVGDDEIREHKLKKIL